MDETRPDQDYDPDKDPDTGPTATEEALDDDGRDQAEGEDPNPEASG